MLQQLESLQGTLDFKEKILEGFAETYVPQIYHQETVSELEAVRAELLESQELVQLLKEQVIFQEDSKLQDTETLALSVKLQEAMTDLQEKDEMISKLKNALQETLSENKAVFSKIFGIVSRLFSCIKWQMRMKAMTLFVFQKLKLKLKEMLFSL